VRSVFFLLNAAFAMTILDLISCVHPASFFHHTIPTIKIFHILQFLIYHNLHWGWFPCLILVLSPHSLPFNSIFQFLQHHFFLSRDTRSSVYFSMPITSHHILHYPNPSGVSSVRYSLCNLNKTDDKQHPV
jgi:hypothetical protein